MLSAAFCGVPLTKKNAGILGAIISVCGLSLLSVLLLFGEQRAWELYPLVVHALLGALLHFIFRKRIITVLGSISLAYLCCQPSKWFGLLAQTFVENAVLVWIVRIVVAAAVSLAVIFCFSDLISKLFSKDTRSVLFFSSVPFVYYLFDYTVGVYTDWWALQTGLTTEFLAFFLCVVFIIFCIIYYQEYETKMQMEQKNRIIEVTVQQQAKELESIRKSNLETSLLRHDMRLLLSNLALCIEQNDLQNARNLISGYVAQVESASLRRYCQNDTINYILTNFESKCGKAGVDFHVNLDLEALRVDEIMFSSILSNALDNALNAQLKLPEGQRQIKLMLRDSDGKLLLSVKNPFPCTNPAQNYASPIPAPTEEGHGFGTQSILYMTEKLGGKCQFSVQNNLFILRVIL